jgi:hypothetical protein
MTKGGTSWGKKGLKNKMNDEVQRQPQMATKRKWVRMY